MPKLYPCLLTSRATKLEKKKIEKKAKKAGLSVSRHMIISSI